MSAAIDVNDDEKPTVVVDPRTKCLHELFAEQADRSPQAMAVVDPDHDVSLTYSELDDATTALSVLLNHEGNVGLDDAVGIYLPKSALYVTACLASCRAGGAFLPLFLDTPTVQLSRIVRQAEVKVVVTVPEFRDHVDRAIVETNRDLRDDEEPVHVHVLVVEDLDPKSLTSVAERSVGLPQSSWPSPPKTTPENLMFVVYTSGTTGEPKGIQLPHRAAVHSYLERYKISTYGEPNPRVACNVFFVWECFRPLICPYQGSTPSSVFVIPDDVIYDPTALLDYLEEHSITEVLFTPSLFESMLHTWSKEAWTGRLSRLRVAWLNGEVVTEQLRSEALSVLPPQVQFLNTYSISECHDVASLDLRSKYERFGDFCPVGYPIDGAPVRLMDVDVPGKPVGRDEAGEVYVAGPGLARGYLGRPDLTAQRFVVLDDGLRYYRTGDVGYFHEADLLEIRGRCDSMVKIRGHSVNLGAVKSALENLPGIASAAAVAIGAEGTDKRLVAYVVLATTTGGGEDEGESWSISHDTASSPKLREALREHLPEFMIPTLFIRFDSLPLSPTTGKLDIKALPAPPSRAMEKEMTDSTPGGSAEEERRLALPNGMRSTREEMEVYLMALWERLLGLDMGTVTVKSNFFHLGGHSLLAARMARHIQGNGLSLLVKDIFRFPTIEELCETLLQQQEQQQKGEEPDAKMPPSDPYPAEEKKEESTESVRSGPTEDDWTLPQDIGSPGSVSTEWTSLQDARGFLVTGATGYLGAFLVAELARVTTTTKCPIYCLVRGENPQERLVKNLSSYSLLPTTTDVDRIKAVRGDLSKPCLGWDGETWEELVDSVDVIFHCGAAVNLVEDYASQKPHTVDGTREILRFALSAPTKMKEGEKRKVKTLHYVSTNGLFPGGKEKIAMYPENSDIDNYLGGLSDNGYGQSKWVAEKLVWQAVMGRNLPAVLYRPGNIGHDRDAARCNPSDFQSLLLKGCLAAGSVPVVDGWSFEMTPVDLLVEAMTTFAHHEEGCRGQVFNVIQGDKVPAERVFAALQLKSVPLEEWTRDLVGAAARTGDVKLEVLAMSLGGFEGYLVDKNVYARDKFDAALELHGVRKTGADLDYIMALVRQLKQ